MTTLGLYSETPTGDNAVIHGDSNCTLNFTHTAPYVAGEKVVEIGIFFRDGQPSGHTIEAAIYNLSTSLISPPNHEGANKVWSSVIAPEESVSGGWQTFAIDFEELTGTSEGDILAVALSRRITGSGDMRLLAADQGSSSLSGATPAASTPEVWEETVTSNSVYFYYITLEADALVDYTGEGGAELGGEADVESFDPSAVLVSYTGEGGAEFSGTAGVEEGNALLLVDYVGQGGLEFGGTAGVWIPPMVVGSGGLSLYGAARVLNVPALPYSPNELFTTNNSLASNFLYNRLLYQRNPLGARDEFTYTAVPEYESLVGLPIEVFYESTTQTILYRVGNVAWEEFAQVEGVQKLDVTMHPEDLLEVCWEVDGEIFTKTLAGPIEKVANGTQPYIVRDERREDYLNSSDTMLVYTQSNSVFLRKKRENYLVEYATSLMDLPPPFTIIGFGMTDTFRLQIRVQVLRSEEI